MKCNAVVGVDARGGNVCCGKPRCEEAGRRVICLDHWRQYDAEMKRRREKRNA
jgi:hypothetical protein